MRAWCAQWAGRWRRLRAGAWLPAGVAMAQWTLVGCAAIASGAHTAGFLGRAAGSGRSLDSLGWFAQVAGGVGALASLAATVVVTPLTWWLMRASLRHSAANPEIGRQHRRAARRRLWLLIVALLGPPLAAAWLSGERALAVAPLWTLAEVPLAALALWAFGAYGLLDYWMRRVCLRIGLAGLVISLVVRRLELLPRRMDDGVAKRRWRARFDASRVPVPQSSRSPSCSSALSCSAPWCSPPGRSWSPDPGPSHQPLRHPCPGRQRRRPGPEPRPPAPPQWSCDAAHGCLIAHRLQDSHPGPGRASTP